MLLVQVMVYFCIYICHFARSKMNRSRVNCELLKNMHAVLTDDETVLTTVCVHYGKHAKMLHSVCAAVAVSYALGSKIDGLTSGGGI